MDHARQHIDYAFQRTYAHMADVGALYDGFSATGLQYGPRYRTLIQAWDGVNGALARLRARSTHEGTQVHPADLDDALCTSAVIGAGVGGEMWVPFAVEDALLQGASSELWAVRLHPCLAATTAIPLEHGLMFAHARQAVVGHG